jgi:hypothetical protein
MTHQRFKAGSNVVEQPQLVLGIHRQLVSEIDIQKSYDSKIELAKETLWLRAKELLSSKRADREFRAEELKTRNSEAQREVGAKVSELQSTHNKFIIAAEGLNGSLSEEISAIKVRLVIGIRVSISCFHS